MISNMEITFKNGKNDLIRQEFFFVLFFVIWLMTPILIFKGKRNK